MTGETGLVMNEKSHCICRSPIHTVQVMAKSPPEKKRSTRGASASPPAPQTPAALRAQLAQLDAQLIAALQQRAALATEYAKLAPADAPQLASLEAEDHAVQELYARHPGPLSERHVRNVMREVVSGCRALVEHPRIAFLGPQYSYSHLAAIHRFGQGVEFVPVGTIAAVFEEVELRHSQFGVVPIENSTDGRVADSLDVFTRVRVNISGLIEMRIHHTLLGKCQRGDVREVYSKPQALSQCRNWLAKHLPGARPVEVTSTSTAAQLAKEKPGAAAIASLQAGIHYGLDVLAEKIEDNPGNLTRFAVIGGLAPKRTGKDRTAMWFQTEHRPGALAEAMNVFRRNAVNLTWIESFPVPGIDRAYLFFVEMEGHQVDARVRKAVAALGRRALRMEVLGSFPAPVVME